jgi:hypothetical protein
MEYLIIEDGDFRSFVSTINEYINNGWELQGGIAVITSMSQLSQYPVPHYYQAVTKTTPPTTIGVLAQGIARRQE